MTLRLYGFGPTRSLLPMWALNEIGLAYEFVSLDLREGEQKRPNFLRLNPAGKVPVLVDGEVVISESVAIVLYLADKHREAGLMPSDPAQRAQVFRWIMFGVTELEQQLFRMTRHTTIYPEERRSPAEIALASEEFATMAAILERHMEGRIFVVGDRFTAADCVTAFLMDWADRRELLDGFPNLKGYLTRMYGRLAAPLRMAAALAQLAPA